MKHKIAKEFKKRYTEQYIDYDIINNCNGYRCVEVFTKNGSKYNLINKQGYTISDDWYDSEIRMSKWDGLYCARVEKDGKLNFIDEKGKLFFPDTWFVNFYGIEKGRTADGKRYEYDLKKRELKEIEKEQPKESYSGGYGMRNGAGNWF